MYEAVITEVPGFVEVDQDDDATYSTQVTVALDRAFDRAVAVHCELAYTTNHGTVPASGWFHEFSFSIAVIDRSGVDYPFLTQDRDIARRYLPEETVPLIMPIVIRSLESLIARVRPKILYRVTKTRNPSERALKKHDLVTDRLHELGYEMLQCGEDSFNRKFWAMGKAH